jgi:DNA-binding Lrp family transcriptional regulator
MVVGYVLINTKPSEDQEVFDVLSKVPEIVELHLLLGEFDMLAKIEADDFNELGRIVVDKIRSVSGVVDTKTLPTGTNM